MYLHSPGRAVQGQMGHRAGPSAPPPTPHKAPPSLGAPLTWKVAAVPLREGPPFPCCPKCSVVPSFLVAGDTAKRMTAGTAQWAESQLAPECPCLSVAGFNWHAQASHCQ